MNFLTIIIVCFSVLGAFDRMTGSRLGIGKEFEKAFMLLGTMALAMIGMIVISPFIAKVMHPFSHLVSEILGIDASIIPASLFANDMGGAQLAVEMASNTQTGLYNALVVSSMMGCTVSFTVPFALGVVGSSQHKDLLLGLLCGIVTIPAGCVVSGIICGISIIELVVNLIPLIVFSGVICLGLIKFPEKCIRIFRIFGFFITGVIMVGLALGIIRFLTGYEVIKGLNTVEDGAYICVNAAIVLSGTFPLMYLISQLLSKPLKYFSDKTGMNRTSLVGMVSSLASSSTTFGMMEQMDRKGVVVNSAFSVSGAFVLGSHLAFTMAFDSSYVFSVIAGKLISGVLAVLLAFVMYKRINRLTL